MNARHDDSSEGPRRPRIGYFLSCEEYSPHELLDQAIAAEEAGFEALWISDHFHPWNDQQGESAFVWTVIGALSQVCSLPVTTAVTCPTMRLKPTLVAQAAASAHVMLDGRFIARRRLGRGPQREHPRRGLARGRRTSAHAARGRRTDPRAVDRRDRRLPRRLLPRRERPHLHAAARSAGHQRLRLRRDVDPAGSRDRRRLLTTARDEHLLDIFRSAAPDKPTTMGYKVAWAATEDEAAGHAHRLWANSGLPGELAQVLPTPRHFEQASTLVTEEQTRDSVVCGPDIDRHVAELKASIDAGFDDIYVANMGPHFADMIKAYGEHVLPAVRG